MRHAIDGVVIGIGPAGAAAAIQLARHGWRIVAVDRETFPRPRSCSGCLARATTIQLRGLLGPGVALPGVACTRLSYVVGGRSIACSPHGGTRLVWRPRLDQALANAAAAAGAELRCGEPAALARSGGGRWLVRVGSDVLHPRFVLLACGSAGLALAAEMGHARRPRGRVQQWTQPISYDVPPIGGAEIHWLRGGSVSLLSPDNATCVVTVVAAGGAAQSAPPIQRLQQLNPRARLWRRLSGGVPNGPVAPSAIVPWRARVPGEGNLLLIGDALLGWTAPPSDGIGHAFTTAGLACQALINGQSIVSTYRDLLERHRSPQQRTDRIQRRLLRLAALQQRPDQWSLVSDRTLQQLLDATYGHERRTPAPAPPS